jgi:hypothetical protein
MYGGCTPNCRFYPEFGVITDEEVIEEHDKLVESLRRDNKIVQPPSEAELQGWQRHIVLIWYDGGVESTMNNQSQIAVEFLSQNRRLISQIYPHHHQIKDYL